MLYVPPSEEGAASSCHAHEHVADTAAGLVLG